jgi:surface antigen
MKKLCVVVAIFIFMTVASCATLEEHKGATSGGVIGAGLGALIGSAVAPGGHGFEGALIGGIAGAILGGTAGHYGFDKKKTQAETNDTHAYNDANVSVRIETVNVHPKKVKAGEKVDLDMTYAVLTTSEGIARVREIREIWIGDNRFGNPETTVEHKGGTYQSNIPIFLPKDAQKGTYKVRYIVQTEYSKDTRETSFTVY